MGRQCANSRHRAFQFVSIGQFDIGACGPVRNVPRFFNRAGKGKEAADGAASCPVPRLVDCDGRDPSPKRAYALITVQSRKLDDEALRGKVASGIRLTDVTTHQKPPTTS